jgi:ABC-2 type transport system ATP-binding protein
MWCSSRLRAGWDDDYARHLVDRFELDPTTKIKALSLGQRSALGSTVGLASRAPLTMFDESYLGMDAISRGVFYDELLGDYLRTQRTFIVSTHLIGEIAPLLEQVVVIDHGRLTLSEDTESLRGRGVMVTGPTDVVEQVTAAATDATVIDVRSLGATTRTTFYGTVAPALRVDAEARGAQFGPVPLQDLLVHLTDLGDERSLVAAVPEERM